MIQKRCPWCGELIEPSIINKYFITNRWGAKCENCQKYYSLKYYGAPLFVSIVLLVLFLTINTSNQFVNNSWISFVGLFIILPLTNRLLYIRTPVVKYNKKSWYEVKEKQYTLKVEINWIKKTNFLSLLIKHASGNIFPACFYSNDGNKVSPMLCVVLNKIKHKNCVSKAHMEFVLDDIPDELFKVGNKFFIFNNKIKIADCIITDTMFY